MTVPAWSPGPSKVQAGDSRLGTELPSNPGVRAPKGPTQGGVKATRLEMFHSSETTGRARWPPPTKRALAASDTELRRREETPGVPQTPLRKSLAVKPQLVASCGPSRRVPRESSLHRRSNCGHPVSPQGGALPLRHTWPLSCHPTPVHCNSEGT